MGREELGRDVHVVQVCVRFYHEEDLNDAITIL